MGYKISMNKEEVAELIQYMTFKKHLDYMIKGDIQEVAYALSNQLETYNKMKALRLAFDNKIHSLINEYVVKNALD